MALGLLLPALAGCSTAKRFDAAPRGEAMTETAPPERERQAAAFEEYFQSIREGATGPDLIRGSSGCGCHAP
jgi:hypothetical protein